MEKQCRENKTDISERQVQILQTFLTKKMCAVLIALLGEELTNKDLAERLEMKTSALANLISRMNKCDVSLFEITKQNKNVWYSLSEAADCYARTFLVSDKIKTAEIIPFYEGVMQTEAACRNALVVWKERAKGNFIFELKQGIEQYYKGNGQLENQDVKVFFENLDDLIMQGQEDHTRRMINLIGFSDLEEDLLQQSELILSFRMLCGLYSENWELAQELVRSVYGKEPSVSVDFLKQSEGYSKEDIIGMVMAIQNLTEVAKGQKMDRKEIRERWSRYFEKGEQLLYVIADRCSDFE